MPRDLFLRFVGPTTARADLYGFVDMLDAAPGTPRSLKWIGPSIKTHCLSDGLRKAQIIRAAWDGRWMLAIREHLSAITSDNGHGSAVREEISELQAAGTIGKSLKTKMFELQRQRDLLWNTCRASANQRRPVEVHYDWLLCLDLFVPCIGYFVQATNAPTSGLLIDEGVTAYCDLAQQVLRPDNGEIRHTYDETGDLVYSGCGRLEPVVLIGTSICCMTRMFPEETRQNQNGYVMWDAHLITQVLWARAKGPAGAIEKMATGIIG
ncbi:hypothetical protein Tco_1456014 [Tanacetum coccineum]